MNSIKSQADLIIWRSALIRLNPNFDNPELFCLILEGKNDIPLMLDDRIIFFTDLEKAESIINKYGKAIKYDEKDIKEPFFYCDIGMLIYVLSSEIIDKERVIVNSVNLLIDMVKSTGKSIPHDYKRYLYALADFFTFESDPSVFYKKENVKKDDVINAVFWSIGAITVKSTVL